ncbi:DUF92 domain-containing protein [Candidatus Micrarchaeota archaeon]|jgi:uncharacterized protein (TIGR00297 family)|nr:DUF92 domain-containing protein [Candidatus Micrarchaeota archaeon]
MKKIEKILLLDVPGLILAVLLGFFVLFFGGIYYLLTLILFLVLSVIATKYGYNIKKSLGIYEHERSWENVVANGFAPAVAIGLQFFGIFPLGAYIGSIAAITSDKFASELGALAGKPIDLSTMKPAKQGKSGCVSVFGLLMSFTGALLIGLIASLFFGFGPSKIIFIGIIGFVGSLIDSLFGVLEEKGIGNKTTTNIICSLVGLVLGHLLL